MARECEQCGSRRFRKDAATGMAICEEGHVVQGFRVEALVQEMTQHVLTKRTIKKGPRRNKRKERGDRNLEFYHGADADFLKHQAFQVMLRLQVQALQRLWQLPSVLEAIARDLWAIQLASHPLPSTSASKIRSDSPFEAMANLSVNSPSGSRRGSRRPSPAGSDISDVSSDTDSDPERTDVDPDLLELLSESDHESGVDDGEKGEQDEDKTRKGQRVSLRAVDTIATLVVALWILRVPVMNVDLRRLIDQAKIPYIDFGHTSYLPATLRSHLNRTTMIALSPTHAPRPIYLHNACIKLARNATRHPGITIPELNASPLIWRCISTLGGTPLTYLQTTRLLAHLDISLSLDVPVKTITKKQRKSDAAVEVALPVMYRDLALPELSAVCAFIMVIKMRYGLDGTPRSATEDEMLPLPAERPWMDMLKTRLDDKVLMAESASLEALDFTRMSQDDMDRLLDLSEHVLLSHRDLENDSMFPLPPRTHPATLSPPTVHPDWSALHASSPVTDPSSELRSGRQYRVYDAKDYIGVLPADSDTLVRAAADVIGVSKQDVLERLQVMERRLKERRRTLLRRA